MSTSSIWETPVINISLMKAKHAMWTINLSSYINSNGAEAPLTGLTDSHRCGLGQWLDSSEAQAYRHFGKFQDLVRAHNHLHQEEQAIVALKQNGEQREAQVRVLSLSEANERISPLLDWLEAQLHTPTT
jgi:3'-phosphoadenosine 5'-phosphosulfate sulfotransferase (PAPS reductase)/FAD synthetase